MSSIHTSGAGPRAASALIEDWAVRIWPELVALAITAASDDSSVWLPWRLACLIRLAWCTAELVHGAGHMVLQVLVDGDRAALSFANLLEHRPAARFAGALLPLAPIGPPDGRQLPIPWTEVGGREPWKVRLKACGGLLLNLGAVVLAGYALLQLSSRSPLLIQVLLASVMAANAWLLLASRTDWEAIWSGCAARFHCGNFGFITGADPGPKGELLSPPAIDRFWTMGLETETRGAQAGGGLVLVRDGQGQIGFVGHKTINGKRGHLTRSLERGFRRARRRAVRAGYRTPPNGLMAAWHYRFGTSGPPDILETHWHQWCPAQRRRLWSRQHGRWLSDWQAVQHRITHNGDFEAFQLFGTETPVNALGGWLGAVLRCFHSAVGDSPKIAGMMDLLICKGDWFASVRLACLRLLTEPDSAPATDALEGWVACFETAFQDEIASRPAAGADHPVVPEELASRIQQRLEGDPRLRRYSPHRIQKWIHAAIGAFLHNDPYAAARQFMACARGSFGLVVISSTWPDRLVLCSLGQPITIGFDGPGALAVYASEPAAVDAVLAAGRGCHRVDLDQNAGEIAVLSSRDLTIHSLSQERELSPEEILCRRHDYDERHGSAGPGPTTGRHRLDPVGADLADIPGLLSRIQDDWINPRSANRASAGAFARLLIAKARHLAEKQVLLSREGLNPALATSRSVDLLVTGVENSLWLGECFARDLEALMPLLTVTTLSANTVLQHLQHDLPALNVGRQSIVLVLSHSGQTFASRQVAEACDLLVRQGVIQEFFLLTGEPASLLGSPWLAPDGPGHPFCHRLFTTAAGRRTAEPATATVAAMHQTLTELLFCLCRQVQQAFPGQRPLGLRLRPEALLALETMEETISWSAMSGRSSAPTNGGSRKPAPSRAGWCGADGNGRGTCWRPRPPG